MRMITLEEHYADQRIIDASNAFRGPLPPMSPERAEAMKFLMNKSFPGPELLDFGTRLEYMDRNGIDMQILSVTAPVTDAVPPADAVRICRQANDITKQHMDDHPDRFGGFASLPMADPVSAAEELERCVRDLGFCGAMIAGRYKGRFYNEKEFLPIFETAERLDVPIYFHPALIPQEIQDAYYVSDAYSYITAAEFSSAGYGWHSEVGIQIVRMILSGIFERFPKLKFISGHWGETMPAMLERMDTIMDREVTGLRRDISEYYKEHVYITPSGIMSRDQLEYIVKVMGADHVMYAIDYPYMRPDNVQSFLADSPLSKTEKEMIAHSNAERILRL